MTLYYNVYKVTVDFDDIKIIKYQTHKRAPFLRSIYFLTHFEKIPREPTDLEKQIMKDSC